MTRADTLAFNLGVQAIFDIAERSAAASASTSSRAIAHTAALSELAQAGRALLLPIDPEQSVPVSADPIPGLHSPVSQFEEISR